MWTHGWPGMAWLLVAAAVPGCLRPTSAAADVQEPPPSGRRVQRESRGEVERRDSLARTDSILREMARLDSIDRADSLRRAAQLPAVLARRDLYFALAGGVSTPTGDFSTPYDPGWNLTVAFGWQRPRSRWGLRGDMTIDAHTGDDFTASTFPPVIGDSPGVGFVESIFEVDHGTVWSGSLAVTVDLLQWGVNRLSTLYVLGGGGVHLFTMPEMSLTPMTGPGRGNTSHYAGERQMRFGLNGGGGVSLSVGRAAVFVESRYFTAYTDNTNSDWVPLIIGMKWY
ncbi:MAG TPA: hypothetical protein VLE53_20010 [Gemmatimonadaceae bacterium]|nr:hypothetical protein [Gemmatimonadaceae bacterium]